jgi:hypothetical protein
MIRREPLLIAMQDGTVSTLTVDEITTDRAVVRSTIEGRPDETKVFERRRAGKSQREQFGVFSWRHALSDSLADCRVRDWLDAHLAGRQVTQ